VRRDIRPFTVEVRRRPRLPTTANPNTQSFETRPPQAAFDRETQRATIAALNAHETDCSPVVDVAASRPTGRILPSLATDEPRHRLLEEVRISAAASEPLSRASKRQSAGASRRGDEASKSSQNLSFSSDENAQSVERSSTKSHPVPNVQSDEGVSAAPREPSGTPNQVVGDSRELALSSKGRKRTITARYVFRDEDKPGERWKRRLLRSR
jgi:hypothetical protein